MIRASLLSHSCRSFRCHPFLLFRFFIRVQLYYSKWIFKVHSCLNRALHLSEHIREQMRCRRLKLPQQARARHRYGQGYKKIIIQLHLLFIRASWVKWGFSWTWNVWGDKVLIRKVTSATFCLDRFLKTQLWHF